MLRALCVAPFHFLFHSVRLGGYQLDDSRGV